MNSLAQPDIHPDADSLNAFVERALPDAERARIVAHMAGCARCREVVYLAQAAAAEETGALPAAGAAVEPRRSWVSAVFAGWRVAWIPAAALAAVGAIVLWVQLRPAPRAVNMAQLAPPQPMPAQPANAAGTAMRSAAQLAAPSTARHEAKAAKPAISSPEELARNEALPNLPSSGGRKRASSAYRPGGDAELTTRQVTSAVRAPEPQAQPSSSASADMAFQPGLANKPWQPQPAEIAKLTSSQAVAVKPTPPTVPPPLLAIHGAAMAPATGGPQTLTVKAVSPQPELTQQAELTPQALNGLAILRLAKHLKLPSGLNSVSSAAMLDRLVAIDSSGSVFLSRDAGLHWEAVRAQWSGKAIEVQAPARTMHLFKPPDQPAAIETTTQPAPASTDEAANERVTVSAPFPPPAPAPATPPAALANIKAAPPIPALLFRLTTDRHQTWVSADGKTWREQ